MHVNYEYICAGIIVLLTLSVIEVGTFNLITHQLTRIEQEKGFPMAEKILDMILLSPGYPADWGDYPIDPVSFGLATQNSLEAYVLDANKVIRLSEDSPHYISPGEAGRLLGLSKNYQFSLKMTPVFLIDIVDEGDGNFSISLTNHKGSQIPNVKVTGYYVPKSVVPGTDYPSDSEITGMDGHCTLNFVFLPNRTLVVCAEQLEVKVVKTDPPNPTFRVEGDRVLESDVPLVQVLDYSTGSVYGLGKESVCRYVEIEGFTYYVEFDLWS